MHSSQLKYSASKQISGSMEMLNQKIEKGDEGYLRRNDNAPALEKWKPIFLELHSSKSQENTERTHHKLIKDQKLQIPQTPA